MTDKKVRPQKVVGDLTKRSVREVTVTIDREEWEHLLKKPRPGATGAAKERGETETP